jgi:hypothetical protein
MIIDSSSELVKYFPKAFLRPHHVAAIRKYKTQSGDERQVDFWRNVGVYGYTFAKKALLIFEYVRDDTIIGVVSGPDDICRAGCRFEDPCSRGEYSGLVAAMLNTTPPDADDLELALMIHGNPAKSDLDVLDKLGIEVGESYRFGDIKRRVK